MFLQFSTISVQMLWLMAAQLTWDCGTLLVSIAYDI